MVRCGERAPKCHVDTHEGKIEFALLRVDKSKRHLEKLTCPRACTVGKKSNSYVAVLEGLLEVITGVTNGLGVRCAVRKIRSHACARNGNKLTRCRKNKTAMFADVSERGQ